jgi:hypothetical protein
LVVFSGLLNLVSHSWRGIIITLHYLLFVMACYNYIVSDMLRICPPPQQLLFHLKTYFIWSHTFWWMFHHLLYSKVWIFFYFFIFIIFIIFNALKKLMLFYIYECSPCVIF